MLFTPISGTPIDVTTGMYTGTYSGTPTDGTHYYYYYYYYYYLQLPEMIICDPTPAVIRRVDDLGLMRGSYYYCY